MPSSLGDAILLSAPHITDADVTAVSTSLLQGWVAPAGPDLDLFEAEICIALGVPHAVALSSGTAALHLGLKYLGVSPGEAVIVPTLSFAATAFAASYLGGEAVLVDVSPKTWTMDPDLVTTAISACRSRGQHVAAIVPVDLYGNTADFGALQQLAATEGIPLLEDAAQALGATHEQGAAGSFGSAAALSFNGNKIITTSGGGMLVSRDENLIDKVRYWSRQSRTDSDAYEHEEIGFNLRLSNTLAALGRSQLSRLGQLVQHRRCVRDWYRQCLSDIDGLSILEDAPWGEGNAWLTVVQLEGSLHQNGSGRVRQALKTAGIESRPIFKPLHQQPVFQDSPVVLSGVADRAFEESLCLPSGAQLEFADVERISSIVRIALTKAA